MQLSGTEVPEMVFIEEWEEDDCGGVSYRQIVRVPYIFTEKKSQQIMASVHGQREDELQLAFGERYLKVHDWIKRDWGTILVVDFIDDTEEAEYA